MNWPANTSAISARPMISDQIPGKMLRRAPPNATRRSYQRICVSQYADATTDTT